MTYVKRVVHDVSRRSYAQGVSTFFEELQGNGHKISLFYKETIVKMKILKSMCRTFPFFSLLTGLILVSIAPQANAARAFMAPMVSYPLIGDFEAEALNYHSPENPIMKFDGNYRPFALGLRAGVSVKDWSLGLTLEKMLFSDTEATDDTVKNSLSFMSVGFLGMHQYKDFRFFAQYILSIQNVEEEEGEIHGSLLFSGPGLGMSYFFSPSFCVDLEYKRLSNSVSDDHGPNPVLNKNTSLTHRTSYNFVTIGVSFFFETEDS